MKICVFIFSVSQFNYVQVGTGCICAPNDVFLLDSFCVCVCVAGGFVLTIAFVLNWLAKQWKKIWTVIMQQYLETSKSPMEQHFLLPSLSLSPPLLYFPPSLLLSCGSSLSRPPLYLTLQNTEESSNCIRQGENRSYTLLCWIWANICSGVPHNCAFLPMWGGKLGLFKWKWD